MKYEWDDNKCQANIAKHGLDCNTAEKFNWTNAIEVLDDRIDYGEDRWIALGFIDTVLHVLIYTERFDTIRIISLRKANKREREYYEKKTR